MIELDKVHADAAPLALRGTSFLVESGVHALLGARRDGPPLVLALVAGREGVRSGRVAVLHGPPSHAAIRRAVAYVPLDAVLPDALRVGESLALAAKVRGEAAVDPATRLGALGIADLAGRRVRSLSREETRAVCLAEALTSKAVRVVLAEEPFVAMEPRAAARLAARMRARAEEGACVVVAVASPREASELADAQLTFHRGVLVRRGDAGDAVGQAPTGASLRILSSNARALLAALAEDAAVTAVEARGDALLVGGPDLIALAAAVGRAATAVDVEIHEMRRDVPSLEVLQAAAAGAQAAYHAAFMRAQATYPPPPRPQHGYAPPSARPPPYSDAPRGGHR